MSAFVVVNPHAANGRTRREWPRIETALRAIYPDVTVAYTLRRGHAKTLVRDALQAGHNEIIAIGGDGTINESVNGMFDEQGPLAPQATFAFVTSGTGGDFRKTFGIAHDIVSAIARLKEGTTRAIDVGRVSCLGKDGETVVRYFINIASFGLSGVIVEAVNRARISKVFGGRFAFAFHSTLAMFLYRDRAIHVCADGGFDEIASISTVAVANGQYFGGGMRVAPDACPDDGVFDMIIIKGVAKRQMLKNMNRLYKGQHVKDANVLVVRTQRVAATSAGDSDRAIFVETDGELAGRLPATFDLLPRALKIRC